MVGITGKVIWGVKSSKKLEGVTQGHRFEREGCLGQVERHSFLEDATAGCGCEDKRSSCRASPYSLYLLWNKNFPPSSEGEGNPVCEFGLMEEP